MARTKFTRQERPILETLWVNRIGARLTPTRNFALIVAAAIALAAPLAAGAITAPLRWPANIQIDRTKRPSSGETGPRSTTTGHRCRRRCASSSA